MPVMSRQYVFLLCGFLVVVSSAVLWSYSGPPRFDGAPLRCNSTPEDATIGTAPLDQLVVEPSSNVLSPQRLPEPLPDLPCECGEGTPRRCHPWRILNIVFSTDSERHMRDVVRRAWERWPQMDMRCGKASATRGAPGPGRLMLLFVMVPPKPLFAESVAAEMKLNGDIVLLDDSRQWNQGQTFRAFQWAWRTFNFDILAKVDTDSFVHVTNMMKKLEHVERNTPTEWIYGLDCSDRICGEAWWASHGVAKFFGTTDLNKYNLIGGEDRLMLDMWKRGVSTGELRNFTETMEPFNRLGVEFSDIKGFAHFDGWPMHPKNIVVHQCKNMDSFKKCSDYHLPDTVPAGLKTTVPGASAIYILQNPTTNQFKNELLARLSKSGLAVPQSRILLKTDTTAIKELCVDSSKSFRSFVFDTRWNPIEPARCSEMSPSSIAHKHSSLRLMSEIMEKGIQGPIIVLDDDFGVSDTFAADVQQAISGLPEGWSVMQLLDCVAENTCSHVYVLNGSEAATMIMIQSVMYDRKKSWSFHKIIQERDRDSPIVMIKGKKSIAFPVSRNQSYPFLS